MITERSSCGIGRKERNSLHNGEDRLRCSAIDLGWFRGHNDKIFCLRWNPFDNDRFVTVGVKHIKFWTKAGGGMTGKQGVFGTIAGKQGKQNQMCVVFGKTVDSTITGGGDGSIYLWNKTDLTRKIDHVHDGPVFVITAVQEKVSSHSSLQQERRRN